VLAAAERRSVSTPLDEAAQHAVDSGYLLVETPEPEPDTAVADKATTRSSGESTKDR
jgi:hypothetical protein